MSWVSRYQKGCYFIHIIYPLNLGLAIGILEHERKQDRLQGTAKGSKGRSENAPREH